jgi:catalase
MISYFYQADAEYGKRLAQYVKMDRQQLESLLSSK